MQLNGRIRLSLMKKVQSLYSLKIHVNTTHNTSFTFQKSNTNLLSDSTTSPIASKTGHIHLKLALTAHPLIFCCSSRSVSVVFDSHYFDIYFTYIFGVSDFVHKSQVLCNAHPSQPIRKDKKMRIELRNNSNCI